MKVCLVTAYPEPEGADDNIPCRWLRESAQRDPFQHHQIVADPAAADLILFTEGHPDEDVYLVRVASHPIFRRYRAKCLLYHDADYAVPLVRGIYPSILRRDYQPERCRSGPYIARRVPNEAIRHDPAPVERKWLYSFFGAAHSPVRRTLLARAHPQGNVRDTTGRLLWNMKSGAEREAFTRDYADALRFSKFVLCPAGYGPSTYRLYETMEMGRVPVIFSDEWVAPDGPDWDRFSLRLPASRVKDFEITLAEIAPRHEEMGRLARAAWEEWFAPALAFHRLIETAREVMALQPSPLSTSLAWATLLRPPHLERWARCRYRALRQGSL